MDRSARVWRIQGKPAAIVAGVSRTPGMISSANARVGGKAALRLSSAGLAASSTSGSSATVSLRLPSSDASAPMVVLKLVMSSLSWFSREAGARRPCCWLPISFDRSRASVPSRAWLTMAVSRRESAE